MKLSKETIEKSYDGIRYTHYWQGTSYEHYENLNTKQKGIFGEQLVSNICAANGMKVESAKTPTDGYDRIINGRKVEIKFSLASKRNHLWHFMFNHCATEKDYERIMFMGVNGDENYKIVWFDKQDFITVKNELFKHQQGGAKLGLDDYICQGKNSTALLNHKLAKSIEEYA